jgi:hypothetical protein
VLLAIVTRPVVKKTSIVMSAKAFIISGEEDQLVPSEVNDLTWGELLSWPLTHQPQEAQGFHHERLDGDLGGFCQRSTLSQQQREAPLKLQQLRFNLGYGRGVHKKGVSC